MAGELHITGIKYTVHLASASEGAEGICITGNVTLNPRGMKIVSLKEKKEDSKYADDYRLQLVAVEDAPRLKVRTFEINSLRLDLTELADYYENVSDYVFRCISKICRQKCYAAK